MRDFERGVRRRDRPHLALDPAEPRRHAVLEAALGHELQPDADAEEGLAASLHGLFERLDHARESLEPPLAIGKGADARQHDALGVAQRPRAAPSL